MTSSASSAAPDRDPTPLLIDVPLRDAASLSAVRYPASSRPAPAIVILTPYRKEQPNEDVLRLAGSVGCDLIVIDVRGLGASGGDWGGFMSPGEISDGVEALEWIARQDFCDGQTAMIGGSYTGGNQLRIAAHRPRGLRCIAPAVPPVDPYRDVHHRGGIQSHLNWGAAVMDLHQHRPSAQEQILREYYVRALLQSFDGPDSRQRSVEDVLGAIDVPSLVSGGWYDFFLRGTVRAFRGIGAPKRLVVGSWGHGDLSHHKPEEVEAWLRFWLRGEGVDPTSGKNVHLQRVGPETWDALCDWPASSRIEWERWSPLGGPVRLPAQPLRFEDTITSPTHAPSAFAWPGAGMHLWTEAWTADTAPVSSPTRYSGPVGLRAVVASDEGAHLDLHARLSIVRADGSIHQLTEGRLRASHRALDLERCESTADGSVVVAWHPHDQAEPVPAGEPVALEVEIDPVNVELATGEALRLGISLVRADSVVGPATATLLPETRLLLPRASSQAPGGVS